MKFKYAFLTLLAGAALAMTGCVEEAPVNDPALAVNVEPSILNFDGKTAGSAQIEVTATASWSTSGVPSWMTVTPPSGSTGTTKVTIAVEAGEEKARSAEVIFKAGQDSKVLTVSQEGGVTYGTLDNPYTCAKAIEFCSTLPDRAKGPKEVYVKGIITRIVEKYGTQYGNATFFMSDDGSADSPEFEVYRAYYFDNKKYDDVTKQNISVGDEVMVYGMIMNYGGQAETSQNEAYLVSLKAGTSPVLSGDVVRAEIMADETEATFTVTAKNLKGKWTVTPKETYSWVSDYTKEGTESGNIVVKVAANTAEEARTAEFTVAAEGVSDVVLTLTQKGAKVVTTVAGIVEQITSTNSKEPSSYAANLAGAVVSYVNGNNAYIEDASGAILLYLANHGLTAGKKISGPVKGTGYLYNGLPEITAIGADAKIEDGGTIPETTMTIANLVANYQANLSRRIKLVGVTVTDAIADGDRNGVVTQNGAEVKVYAGLNNKGLALAEGATGDLICYPTLYKETKQVSFWDNADWTVGTTPTPQPDGTIKTADELIAWFAAPTAAAKLGADIDLTGKTFSPVADLTVEFDGNGKTITVKDLETPVFTVAHATIKNVVFAGSFKGSPSNVKFHLAPIGKSYAAIENVINKATVTVTGAAPEDGGGTVAGIVCEAYGPVKNCKNEGKISVDASGKDTWTYAVAGVAGFLGAAIEGCDNSGEVILVAGSPLGRTAVMTEVSMKYNPVSSVAGVVAYAVSDHTHDVTVTNCNNTAKVTFTYDNINDESAAVSRSSVAGIVANSGGDIKNCDNRGEINATMVTATPNVAFSAKNIILHAAGIQGADYFVSKIKSSVDQNETSIFDCNNYGNINVNTNLTASNNTAGGVSAWPAAESASITVIKNCTNSGNITVTGLGKIRVGGVAGGTNSIENCKSSGNILVDGADPASVFGLINGFHTQTHKLSDCEATGKLESKVAVTGLGGLCGGIGNVENAMGENCKVNATIIGGGTTQVGLIVGNLNGKSKNITVGTADKPVRVAGSVDGVEATADNFKTLLHHANNYTEGIHTFNAVFGK